MGRLDMGRLEMKEVFTRTKAILVEVLGVEEDAITPEATLIGDLGAESIDFLDISFRIEKEFGVKFPKEELDKLTAVVSSARIEAISDLIQEQYNATLSPEEKDNFAYLETELLIQKLNERFNVSIGPEVTREASLIARKRVMEYLKGLGFSGEIDESNEVIKAIEEAHPGTLQEQVVRMLSVQSLVNYIAAAQPV